MISFKLLYLANTDVIRIFLVFPKLSLINKVTLLSSIQIAICEFTNYFNDHSRIKAVAVQVTKRAILCGVLNFVDFTTRVFKNRHIFSFWRTFIIVIIFDEFPFQFQRLWMTFLGFSVPQFSILIYLLIKVFDDLFTFFKVYVSTMTFHLVFLGFWSKFSLDFQGIQDVITWKV